MQTAYHIFSIFFIFIFFFAFLWFSRIVCAPRSANDDLHKMTLVTFVIEKCECVVVAAAAATSHDLFLKERNNNKYGDCVLAVALHCAHDSYECIPKCPK